MTECKNTINTLNSKLLLYKDFTFTMPSNFNGNNFWAWGVNNVLSACLIGYENEAKVVVSIIPRENNVDLIHIIHDPVDTEVTYKVRVIYLPS